MEMWERQQRRAKAKDNRPEQPLKGVSYRQRVPIALIMVCKNKQRDDEG